MPGSEIDQASLRIDMRAGVGEGQLGDESGATSRDLMIHGSAELLKVQ